MLEETERKNIQEQQPNRFHSCNQNMGFVNKMDHNLANYRYPNEKMVVVHLYLTGRCCSSYCIVLRKMKAMSFCLFLLFEDMLLMQFFLKYSKKDRLFKSHLGIRNIPSDVCYDDTKHYQVQFEHRRIQSPFKHLRGTVFV